jgi:hypothetical protein
MGQWDYRTPGAGMQPALRSSYEPSIGSGSVPSPYSLPRNPTTYIYASNKSALADAWREFLKRHPELERFTLGFNPWNKDPAVPGQVNVNLSISQRQHLAVSYGTVFPSHGDLTAWRASQRLLPPTEQELAEIDGHNNGSFSQIPAALKAGGTPGAPATPAAGPGRAKASNPYSEIPEHLRHFRVGATVVPVAPVSDPCKNIKDKLSKSERELESWKHRQWKFELPEVRERCADWYEEWRAKSILYDPVRKQLSKVEDELGIEKRDHKAAKEQLALADPKTIKTNAQQIADAAAQKKKLEAAQKESDKLADKKAEEKIKEAEKQAEVQASGRRIPQSTRA